MPLIIWQPRKYEAGFPKRYDRTFGYYEPEWTAVKEAPYNGDTLVREVARWKGWTQQYYSSTGEFEAEIEAGQVQPADIKLGNFVRIEDRHYQIESIEWTKSENGYSVVISGRGIERMLDDLYRLGIHVGRLGSSVIENGYEQGSPLMDRGNGYVVQLQNAFERTLFKIGLFNQIMTENSALDYVSNDIPDQMSMICEKDRVYYPEKMNEKRWLLFDLQQANLTNTANDYFIQDACTIGGAIRSICSLFGVGYNLHLEYDNLTRLHKVALRIYDRADDGVVITTEMRGVTNFVYSSSARDEINTCIYRGVSRYAYYDSTGALTSDKPIYPNYASKASKEHFGNWSEMANLLSCRYIDRGEIDEEYDTGVEAAQEYLLSTNEQGDLVDRSDDISFTYDNTGQYKYGHDFFLGSKVSIVDEYIGVGSTQTLTGVKTLYNSGAVKEYEFTFGRKAITSADKLLKKFSQLNTRGFVMGVRQD